MNDKTSVKNISYLNKDFVDFRQNLLTLAKTYYKDTITDFNPSDPALMYIDMASYIGDVLSFYQDINLKENQLIVAEERNNVVLAAQALGYKPRPSTSSTTNLSVYQLIPSIGSGESIRPDFNYALKINSGMQVSSTNGTVFRTKDDIDFAFSSSFSPTNITIYTIDDDGNPTYYLLEKKILIESGVQKSSIVSFSDPIKYSKVLLNDINIISVDSIVDSDNNIWYEVSFLAQDSIFVDVPNTEANDQTLYQYSNQTPYLLKIQRVPKRFITRYRLDNKMELQFGAGVSNDYDEEILPNPDNVGLMTPTGNSKLNYSWAVSNFLYSDAYGQAPGNTTLTIKYTIGGGISSNVLANTIQSISEVAFSMDETNLDATVVAAVKNSLACNNLEAAVGGRGPETTEEIRQNALAYFSAQDRAVNKNDYIIRTLSMPSKFGSIAKAYIVQDDQLSAKDILERYKNPLALNLYILSYDANKRLVNANNAIKENLKFYLDKYRMITDTINIKNAFIINIGINFEISVLSYFSAKEVLLECINRLKLFFNIDRWQINQPIIISDIQRAINEVKGVQNIIDLKIVNKFDINAGYSGNIYGIESATRNGIIYPSLDPSIFEIRFPNTDIYGKVKTY